MTRARQTLAIFDQGGPKGSLADVLRGPAVLRRTFAPRDVEAGASPPCLAYRGLGLDSIHLGYPAQFPPGHAVHRALAALEPGQRLGFRDEAPAGIFLCDASGTAVARLSRQAEEAWRGRLPTVREVRVLALVRRGAAQDPESERRARYASAEWEVPWVEVVTEESAPGERGGRPGRSSPAA
jgi:hypothetical protein